MVDESATETALLREYYASADYLGSLEGILKILAVLGCLAAGVLFLGGGCAGSGLAGAGAAALAAAALLVLQLCGTLLGTPRSAPHAWLYSDMVASSVLGALQLLGGALGLARCERRLVHASLALANALLLFGGAVATHRAVTRRWDAARGPAREPRRASPAPPADLDV